MYVDNELRLSDGQDVKANSTKTSSNVVDLSAVLRDIGEGRQLYIVVIVDKYTAGSNTQVDIIVQTGATDSLGTEIIRKVLPYTAISAGMTPIVIPIPPGIAERYLGLVYDCTTAATEFNVTAFVALDV